MRLAKLSRTLLLLALPAVLAACAFAQEHPNIRPNAVRGQMSQAPSQPRAAGSARRAPAKPAAQRAPRKSVTAPGKATAVKRVSVKRRDPFETLLNKAPSGSGTPQNLPPGKAGLIVSTLRINGIVRDSNGMIAIVSNPQKRVYFLREGDKLYDGSVDKISLDSISFHEFGKDAFGKPLERQVTKRLYPSPGEQQ
jgi:Tfp pilus assembly protein PilP